MINDQTELMINAIHAERYLKMTKLLIAEIVRHPEVKITDRCVEESVNSISKECAEIDKLLEEINNNNYSK